MDAENSGEIWQWLREQVEEYEPLCDSFQRYAGLLQEVLQAAAGKHAPLAIVQMRPKSTASLSRKALLKRCKYLYGSRRVSPRVGLDTIL